MKIIFYIVTFCFISPSVTHHMNEDGTESKFQMDTVNYYDCTRRDLFTDKDSAIYDITEKLNDKKHYANVRIDSFKANSVDELPPRSNAQYLVPKGTRMQFPL